MLKRRHMRIILFVVSFLVFVLMMDYPYLTRIFNDMVSGEVISSFEKQEENRDLKKALSEAKAYNRTLAGSGDLLKSGLSEWKRKARVLCTGPDEQAGWIRIASLDLKLPLYVGTGDRALREGAGILEGSSLPVGGSGTHNCISAHRGLPDRTLFTNLDLLKEKDLICVHTLGRTIAYEVTGHETVLPTQTQSLSIRPGEDLLTLITCTPYGINSHRLYVHAKRTPYREDEEREDQENERSVTDLIFWKLYWWIPATILLIVFMIVLVLKAK